MKIWTFSLWLSIISASLLFIIFLLSNTYGVFVWGKLRVDPGVLFPVLLLCWTTALFAFGLNNIFIDKALIDKKIEMTDLRKHLPSLLVIPSFISFGWFIYRWFKGTPIH